MKLKKWTAVFLAACMAAVIPLQAGAAAQLDIKAPSAVLLEEQTGKLLYEKNPHEKRPCASITKVMTLLLVMEALDSGKIKLTDQVSASAHAASMGGSDIWLKEGETMTVNDLIKSTVIMSANDAAVVLAEYVAGTEDDFVRQMNEKAAQLGMKDTTFKNCNGLDEDGHLTSAYDVALMSRALMKHKKIFDYTTKWIDSVRGGATQLVNTNKLLKRYKGITGLKTGTTSKAGSCISATAKRNGLSLIAVVLGSPSTKDRFADATKLLDYGFANWAVSTPKTPSLPDVPVVNGMTEKVGTVTAKSHAILVPKGKEKEVKAKVNLNKNVRAPVKKGQVLGNVNYLLGEEVIGSKPICAASSVAEITMKSCFRFLLKSLVSFS